MALKEDPELIKKAVRRCRKVIRFLHDEMRRREDAYVKETKALKESNASMSLQIAALMELREDDKEDPSSAEYEDKYGIGYN